MTLNLTFLHEEETESAVDYLRKARENQLGTGEGTSSAQLTTTTFDALDRGFGGKSDLQQETVVTTAQETTSDEEGEELNVRKTGFGAKNQRLDADLDIIEEERSNFNDRNEESNAIDEIEPETSDHDNSNAERIVSKTDSGILVTGSVRNVNLSHEASTDDVSQESQEEQETSYDETESEHVGEKSKETMDNDDSETASEVNDSKENPSHEDEVMILEMINDVNAAKKSTEIDHEKYSRQG